MAEYPVNPLKKKLREGGIGTLVLGLNNADACDYLGQFGFDAMFAEMEHGPVSFNEVADISRACELWNMAAIVRVNRLDPALITRTLDRGASGIIVPHVITADDARLLARSVKYPPEGIRGMFGGRRSYGVKNFPARANEEVMAIALVEDIEAVRNIKDLVAVDGVDVYSVAPSDLAASMGHTAEINHPAVQQAIDDAIGEIVKAGRVAGTLVSDDNVEAYIKKGVRCLTLSWLPWVARGAEGFLAKVDHR